MTKKVEDILQFCQEKGVRMIDFKTVDLTGRWHHVTIPVERFNEDTVKYGIGFDGSNFGYASVEKSDMVFPMTAAVEGQCIGQTYHFAKFLQLAVQLVIGVDVLFAVVRQSGIDKRKHELGVVPAVQGSQRSHLRFPFHAQLLSGLFPPIGKDAVLKIAFPQESHIYYGHSARIETEEKYIPCQFAG